MENFPVLGSNWENIDTILGKNWTKDLLLEEITTISQFWD